jgi:hypothetical protein
MEIFMSKIILQSLTFLAISGSFNNISAAQELLTKDTIENISTEEATQKENSSLYEQGVGYVAKFNALSTKEKALCCAATVGTLVTASAAADLYLKGGNTQAVFNRLKRLFSSQIAQTDIIDSTTPIRELVLGQQQATEQVKTYIANLLGAGSMILTAAGLATLSPFGSALAFARGIFATKIAPSIVLAPATPLLSAPACAPHYGLPAIAGYVMSTFRM